jgi:predicted transcriptional regulator
MLHMLFQLLKSAKNWVLSSLNNYEDDVTFTQRALKEYREHISHKIQP